MSKLINLNIDTIMNKEFSIDFKGYSPIEVDQFLDNIAKDYESYQSIIAEMQERIDFLEENEENLKAKNIDLENKLKVADENIANSTSNTVVGNLGQIDILRRIARLEQEVFKSK